MEKETEKAVSRPLCLELRDTKTDIVNTVNAAMQQRGIPCFLLRGILEEILTQVKEIEKKEIETAEAQYAAALENKESEEENK